MKLYAIKHKGNKQRARQAQSHQYHSQGETETLELSKKALEISIFI
jgi:hypothetical protein